MCESRRLRNLRAPKASYRDSFTYSLKSLTESLTKSSGTQVEILRTSESLNLCHLCHCREVSPKVTDQWSAECTYTTFTDRNSFILTFFWFKQFGFLTSDKIWCSFFWKHTKLPFSLFFLYPHTKNFRKTQHKNTSEQPSSRPRSHPGYVVVKLKLNMYQ
jgi:hypothetical protein